MVFANADVTLQYIVDETLIKFPTKDCIIKFPTKDCISKSKAPTNSMLTKSILAKTLEQLINWPAVVWTCGRYSCISNMYCHQL